MAKNEGYYYSGNIAVFHYTGLTLMHLRDPFYQVSYHIILNPYCLYHLTIN